MFTGFPKFPFSTELTWPVIFQSAADGHNIDLVRDTESKSVWHCHLDHRTSLPTHLLLPLLFLYNPFLHPAASVISEEKKLTLDDGAPSIPAPVQIL